MDSIVTGETYIVAGRQVSPRQLNVIVGSLLLVLALGFMSPGLPPWRVAAPMEQVLVYAPWHYYYPDAAPRALGGDLLLQQLPWRHWMRQELAAGRFPLWDSAPLGGLPLFADFQPGVLYPLHLLWALLPVGPASGVIMALKLWLAGLGMWFFLRALGLRPSAALLSALGFMFSAWMVDLLGWQVTSVYLLLPWMAWASYAWCREGRRPALAWLALLSAFAIFGGHPETQFIVGVVLLIWTLSLLEVRRPRRLGAQVAGLAVSVALGLGLAAVQVLPFLQVFELSHVAVQRPPNPRAAALHLEGELKNDWVLPRSWGHFAEGVLTVKTSFTEGNGYVGLVALLGLGLAGLAAAKRRLRFRLAAPWVVIGLFAWLVTYEELGTPIRALPGFNQSISVRWVAIIAFAALVVSAFGWDWFARRAPSGDGALAMRRWPQGALGTAGALLLFEGAVVMAVHAAGMIPPPEMQANGPWLMVNDSYRFYWAIWAVGVALAVLGATALWSVRWRARRLGPLLLGLVLVIDLWRLLITINGTAPAEDYFPQTSFLRQVKDNVPPTERILVAGDVMPPNTPMVFGIRDWRAQDALLSERAYQALVLIDPDLPKSVWTDYNVLLLGDLRLPVAPLFGMRYFIFPSGINPNTPGLTDKTVPAFTRLAYKDGLGLWRAEGVPGFTYLSDNVQVVSGEKEAREWARNLTWEQARQYPALVEAPASAVQGIQPDAAHNSPGKADVTEYAPGHVRLRVSAARQALLVVAESWYPGWRATLDGEPVGILRANYLSQGVVVPAGEHTVDLRYTPGAFIYGAWISALSALGIAGLFLWAWWPRRR